MKRRWFSVRGDHSKLFYVVILQGSGKGTGTPETMTALKEPGIHPENILQTLNYVLVLRELRLKQNQWKATGLMKSFHILRGETACI